MMDSVWITWIVLPLLIVLARVTDVTIGTLRIIFVMRGIKFLAALLGFVEVLVWIIVIGRLMSGTTIWLHYVAYAVGFALGNVIGIKVEEKLAFGLQTVRVITVQEVAGLLDELKSAGCGATLIPAFGMQGRQATILFTTVRRETVPRVLAAVHRHVPRAFVSVEDVRSVREGVFPAVNNVQLLGRVFPFARKGK